MYANQGLPQSLFKVSIPKITTISCILPMFATTFCVTYSIINNFEQSTLTHCQVYNFLPSISAAIGDFRPQVYVWRLCIALHSGPRFLLAMIYYGFHTTIKLGRSNEHYMTLAAVSSLSHITEIVALLGLSYISSSDNFGIHKLFFITFMLCAYVHMVLTMIIFYWGRTQNGRQLTYMESKSFKWKKILFGINLGVFLLAMYFYNQHMNYCQNNVYSYFAFCEYIVIFSNIGYHGTAILDFKPQSLLVQAPVKNYSELEEVL
ncbi:hypothetical protein LOTGIDRAFT_203082 [Lottia gigantea]|uniref:CWH43-like N-terminal domain-containing protein n=1 Tax=Lottia gigantea TaxID=225164 RepID=V4BXF5_LOTGI|nr:hypothetical protein LOTGIDRAFT_203082 [Lottia gigantea]ESO93779.1 hypothetical protein LOTGIDRAFT_203082 [Lottia gigantea]